MRASRLLFIATLGIAGCHEGSAPVPQGSSPAAATTVVTVTPSLGTISNASVTLSQSGGGWSASGNTGTAGIVAFAIPDNLAGPFLVEVCGNGSATYFDEALEAPVPFGAGTCLRALLPDLSRSNVGVTALSEAAVRYLESHGGVAAATPADAAAALELVRSHVLPEVADPLQAPTLVDSASALALLPADDAGRYALKLAAFARSAKALGDTRGGVAAPALAFAQDLASDLADGSFDGTASGSYLISPAYDIHQLAPLLSSQLSQLGLGSAGLATLVDSLGGQLPLQGLAPAPGGDALLSWQGSYSGLWSSVSVDAGTLSGSSALTAFRSQLVNGQACGFSLDNGELLVAGLPFPFDLASTSAADADGVRRFSFQRKDNVTVSLGGFSVPMTITSQATLVTQGSQVQRMEMVASGVALGTTLSNIANANCSLPTP